LMLDLSQDPPSADTFWAPGADVEVPGLTGLDMVLPDVIPDWVLVSPPLPELPSACCPEPEPEPEPGSVWPVEVGWAVPGVSGGSAGEPGQPQRRRPAPSLVVTALLVATERVCAVDPRRLSPGQALVDGEVLLRVGHAPAPAAAPPAQTRPETYDPTTSDAGSMTVGPACRTR